MHWVIKTAKSAIGVIDPVPYLVGYTGSAEAPVALWGSHRCDALKLRDKGAAFAIAHLWGPTWRDAVRVVRLVRRHK